MDRYLLVLNVGTSLHSMTARQRRAGLLALTEKVPASLFPFFPVPPPKDFWLRVKGCSSRLLQLASQQAVLEVLFPAHTCTHTLAITVDYIGYPYPAQSTTYTDANTKKKPKPFLKYRN